MSGFLFYMGGVIALCGVLSLTILQFRLIGRYEKSFFSILSIWLHPEIELSPFERRLKKIGGILLVLGSFLFFIPLIFNSIYRME